MEKTKVTIVAQDGKKIEMEDDTVICFGISGILGFIFEHKGVQLSEVGVGFKIPDSVFESVVARAMGNFIEEFQKDSPLRAAEALRGIGRRLNKRGIELYFETEFGKPDESPKEEPEEEAEAKESTVEAMLAAAKKAVTDNGKETEKILDRIWSELFKE